MRLKDTVAVITGSGGGMGAEMAKLFAAEGAKVVVSDIAAAGVEKVVAKIRAAGGTAIGQVTDVTDEAQVEALIDGAVREFGKLDILVNNAGIVDAITPAADTSTDLWQRVLAVNINGPFYASRAALKHMVPQGRGSIVHVGSVASLQGGRGGAAYTTSKHALVGLSKSIAQMYAAKGIRSNVMCPGAIETGIPMGGEPHPEGTERLMKTMVFNARSGQPAEMATVALFLASDEASYVNGAVLVADGGWTAI